MNPPTTSTLIRQASLRAFLAGFAVAALIATALTLVHAAHLGEFRHGAVLGFGVGVGVMLGGTLLNVVVGLIDQAKTDITGT